MNTFAIFASNLACRNLDPYNKRLGLTRAALRTLEKVSGMYTNALFVTPLTAFLWFITMDLVFSRVSEG